MKRVLTALLPVLLALGVLGAPAWAKSTPATAAKAPATAGAKPTSVTGPVKGSVNGKKFTIGRRGGPVDVDATGATVRDNGKFASLNSVKGGTMVTVTGTMDGTILKATEVNIHSRKKDAAPKK